MRNFKLFGRSVPAIAIALLLIGGLASAGLLSYYGRMVGTAEVGQSVKLCELVGEEWKCYECIGGDYSQCTIPYTVGGSAVAGNTYIDGPYALRNDAEVPAEVEFETSCSAYYQGGADCGGITTTYWKGVEYSAEFLAEDTDLARTNITVEDLGDSILWTIQVPLEYTVFGEGIGPGGQAAVGLIIEVGDEILYQVHSNDGTCAAFDWGTWLYSEYDDDWHTGGPNCGDTNTLITAIEGIEATGTRLAADCGGNYTIKIDKGLLVPEFKWAINLPYENYKSLPPGFSWSDTHTANFYNATLAEEIPEGSFILQPGETMGFVIVNSFNIALIPDTYTITTKIVPAYE